MTYPTPNPDLQVVSNSIVSLLQPIPYLASGGTIERAQDPKKLEDFSVFVPPFVIVVPNGEGLATSKNWNLGGAVFETEMHWSLYIGATSFSLAGDAAGSVVGDPGIDAMLADVRTALLGQQVAQLLGKASKLFPANPFYRRYTTTNNAIVFEMNWKNQWLQMAV